MNFFKKFLNSIINFESYKDFHLENSKKPILYLLKLCLLTSTIFCIVLFYLVYSKSILIENDAMLIIVDINASQEKIEQYKEDANEYSNSYLFVKDKLIYKTASTEEVIPYYDTQDSTLDNQGTISSVDSTNKISIFIVMFVIVSIVTGLFYFIAQLIYILMLSIFGVLSKNILKLNLGYSSIFNISVYGFSLSIILELIFNIISITTNFVVSNLDTMMMAVGYVYVLTALITIRNNMLNMQLEYSKLKMATEQGPIDIEKEEKEEKEEKKENPRDKDDDKDKEQDKDKDKKTKDNFNHNKKQDE